MSSKTAQKTEPEVRFLRQQLTTSLWVLLLIGWSLASQPPGHTALCQVLEFTYLLPTLESLHFSKDSCLMAYSFSLCKSQLWWLAPSRKPFSDHPIYITTSVFWVFFFLKHWPQLSITELTIFSFFTLTEVVPGQETGLPCLSYIPNTKHSASFSKTSH